MKRQPRDSKALPSNSINNSDITESINHERTRDTTCVVPMKVSLQERFLITRAIRALKYKRQFKMGKKMFSNSSNKEFEDFFFGCLPVVYSFLQNQKQLKPITANLREKSQIYLDKLPFCADTFKAGR